MNCQWKWIREAALGTLDASRLALFNAHLDRCVACRGAFEAERRLLAAIDQGIVTRVQGAPSAQFAAGVRARLSCLGARASCSPLTGSLERAGRPRSQAWWRPTVWSPALALGALAILLLTLWLVRPTSRPRVPERVRSTTPAAPTEKPRLPEQMAAAARPKTGSPTARPHKVGGHAAHRTVLPQSSESGETSQLEVLVDPGQAKALGDLVRTMQRGMDPVGLASQSAKAEDPIRVPAIEVKPVVIAQLEPPKPLKPPADERDSQ